MRQFTTECNLTKKQDTQIIVAINRKLRKYATGNNTVCIPFGVPKLTAIKGGHRVAMNLRLGGERTIMEFNIQV